MELTATQIAIISTASALVGVVMGCVLTYWFAWRLTKKTARLDAGRRLREAFQPEQAALDPTANFQGRADELLHGAWPRHHAAISEFMFHLPPKERAAFKAAWCDYYLVGGSIRFFDYHLGESREADCAKFQERVDAILKFTRT